MKQFYYQSNTLFSSFWREKFYFKPKANYYPHRKQSPNARKTFPTTNSKLEKKKRREVKILVQRIRAYNYLTTIQKQISTLYRKDPER